MNTPLISEEAIIAQWAVAIAVALILMFRGQLNLFHPTTIYLAFHVNVFCVRPTLLCLYDFDMVWRYIGFWPTPAQGELALFLSSAGLIAFCGTYSLIAAMAKPIQWTIPWDLTEAERRAYYMVAAVFFPLALYSVFGARVQGERVGGVYIMTGSSGYINDLQQVLIPLTLLFLVVNRWRWYAYIPFGLFIVYRATQGWGRWTIVLSLYAALLMHCWGKRRTLPSLQFVVLLPIAAIIFANLGHDRMYIRNLIAGTESSNVNVLDKSKTFSEKFDTLDFANFDYLVYVAAVVPEKTKTYTYATQYLQLFTEPIPRKLWKGKPVGPPVVMFDLNDHGNFNGLTPSLVGDGWMSGGWIGSILTMALVGGMLGYLYKWFSEHQFEPARVYVFIISNAMMVQLFRDGGISIFKFLLFSLLPIFAWQYVSRRMTEEAEATRQQPSISAPTADFEKEEQACERAPATP